MKTNFILSAIASAFVLAGCASHSSAKVSDAEYVAGQAQSMQNRGLMSKADYVEVARISDIVGARKKLSDSDFDELLDLMRAHQPFIRYYPTKLIISTHIITMALCRNMKVASPDQKQKMVAAVTPLLDSPNKYEHIIAKQIVDKFGASH